MPALPVCHTAARECRDVCTSVARTHHCLALAARWAVENGGGGGCKLRGRGRATTSPSIPQAPPLPAEVIVTWTGTGRHSVRPASEGVPLGFVDQNAGSASLTLAVVDLKLHWNLPRLHTVLTLLPSLCPLALSQHQASKFIKHHRRKSRCVKHSQTLQLSVSYFSDGVLSKVLPRKTSLDPRSRRLSQLFLTPLRRCKVPRP